MLALILLGLVPLHAPSSRVELVGAGSPEIDSRVEPRYSLDEILEAIRTIESGGHKDGGRHAIGDGGRAIGPFQIHRVHWLDTGVPGRFEDCRDPKYARTVVIAYWKRWCPEALERCDAEVLARTHNGGPQGAKKASTIAYWAKVERALAAARPASE
jgi:hypothetical protein